ncbi:hypothetical protein [Paraburkholderia sp. JHI869]|uniref:hypothetical protein n=1 Tax=Paraburkholderia sp. JHI869 TaxID=3112959 RepID=UPI0031767905
MSRATAPDHLCSYPYYVKRNKSLARNDSGGGTQTAVGLKKGFGGTPNQIDQALRRVQPVVVGRSMLDPVCHDVHTFKEGTLPFEQHIQTRDLATQLFACISTRKLTLHDIRSGSGNGPPGDEKIGVSGH